MNNTLDNICALYLRLSDEDRNKKTVYDDSESIKNQKALLLDYASKHNYKVYDIYSDDDFSGADISTIRPEYNRLLQDAENRKFNTVLCKSQARFTRDMAHVEYYLHNKFIEWGVRFIGVSDNADTNVQGNKKARQINGLVNEWYLEDLSKNIKSAFEIKKQQGQFVGANPCYGYMRDPNNKNALIIDEEAAQIVRRIFEMYNNGMGCYSIATTLNSEHILTPSMYKYEKGIYKTPYRRGSQSLKKVIWDNSNVGCILRQRIYVGDMVQNKQGTISYKNQKRVAKPKEEWIIAENTHEPIIDRETFERAQKIAGTRRRPMKNGNLNLYTGIIRCGECGGIMTMARNRKRKDGEPSTSNYRCNMHEKAKDQCVGACISDKKINTIVINEINKLLESHYDGTYMDKHISMSDITQKEIYKLEEQKQEIARKIELSNKATTDLYLDKVKGVINEEQFIVINNNLILDLEHNKQAYEDIENNIQSLNSQIVNSIDRSKILNKYKHIENIDREKIQEFIKAIYIKNTDVRNQKIVEIQWNF